MEHMIIREARAADCTAIADINTRVFLGDRDHLDSAFEWVQSLYRAYPVYRYFVVEKDGDVIGYAGWQLHGGFSRAEPVIELDQIGIDPAHQGGGLASLLMERCMDQLVKWVVEKNSRIESHVTFVVWAYAFNFNAVNAYAKRFTDGVSGMRTQFGNRSELMLRVRRPLIKPVRDE